MMSPIEESLICHKICSYMSLYDKQCARHISRPFYEECKHALDGIDVVATCGLYTILGEYWLPHVDIKCDITLFDFCKDNTRIIYDRYMPMTTIFIGEHPIRIRDKIMYHDKDILKLCITEYRDIPTYDIIVSHLLCEPKNMIYVADFLDSCTYKNAKFGSHEINLRKFLTAKINMNNIDRVVCINKDSPFSIEYNEYCRVRFIRNIFGATIEEFIAFIEAIFEYKLEFNRICMRDDYIEFL